MTYPPVGRSCICMPTGRGHGAHLPALGRHSLGFRAAGQAVLGLPAGASHSGSQRAGQARAAVAWGRALVVAAAQPSATWQVTWRAVAITAAAAALVAATGLPVAALLLTPAETFVVRLGQFAASFSKSIWQQIRHVAWAVATVLYNLSQKYMLCSMTGCYTFLSHLPR